MMIYYCTLRGCPNLAGDSGYLILIWLLISQNSIGITAPTGHSCEMIYGCKKEFFLGEVFFDLELYLCLRVKESELN